mmetsp:Transcript_19939/g.39147  ORF Transcript_19939/g.39147 Transcript_19939/m.39147 type:complete len:308 (-) Transcript_19939:307-1230(-)|eukprot:CAMPEP_0171494924 /NCGR_PEP_ID=MMETSP0958-20121227/5831_1 /TAXON_ID=87120 /ORGANISM="Aurantiochytrium limacinum, Strain ATCCMYA-1381" /LENGTH=307 /DNA_ID=CAMNT_0012028799 /DNA_START=86 /DNA_END=1009 /DNA_ORIENTATION=+
MRKSGKSGGTLSTAYAVVGYMACSAGMLLVNKLAVHHLPTPGFVLLCQLAASAVFTWGAGKLGYIEVDPLSMEKVRQFWLVPVAFLLTVFANIKILQYSNVETFITFRASTPLIISVLDWLLLGRELPSRKSLVCLLGLLVGALLYLNFEKGQMTANSYFWVIVWYCVFVFDQIFIKHVTNTVEMTTWGRVYYTNALPVIPLFFIMYYTGEFEKLSSMELGFVSQFWLFLSCACGVAISYYAFLCRAAVSATSFTVLGNTCKVITVTLNILVWDNHATPEGVMSLFMCLVCAYFYDQAPIRQRGLPE